MFDKNKFAKILKNINDTYESQREFSKKSDINRTYLSQYMNMKLDEPPKPKLLEKLAVSSHGVTTYAELMEVCGYVESLSYKDLKDKELNKNKSVLYNRGFSQSQIDKITYYCMKTYTGKDPQFQKDTKDFEEFLKTLSPEDVEFVINFNTNIALNVAKQYNNLADKTQAIYDKSNDLISKYDFDNAFQFYMCPVYGQISAGQPNWAEECIEGRLPIDPNLMNIVDPEECYFLRVNGESMNKIVKNGSYALIRKTDWVDDGEIAVVLVNGYDATLKKFSKQGDFVVLEPMSTDPSFKTQIYTKDTPIKIIGKYIGKFEIKS